MKRLAGSGSTRTGRFFFSLPALLLTLLGYGILGVATFFAVWHVLSDSSKAFVVAYTVATGGDPFTLPFISELRVVRPLWWWILFFRFATWLWVPVLAAAALDAAYRAYEERRRTTEKEVRIKLRQIGERRGLEGSDLEEFVNGIFEQF